MLPVSRPSVGHDEAEALRDVLASAWLGQGEWTQHFEARLSEYCGGREVVAVSSGTSALFLALDALGVKAGDEVIVPSLTFCASVQAITATGAKPVFCDVDADTANLDLEDAARCITPRTRAIMPVHYAGNPCNQDAVYALARAHGLRVVEDAAHAFGSSYNGQRLGSFGDLVCFSFDPIKNLTCGEGGAVVLGDETLAAILRRKRVLGIDRDGWQRFREKSGMQYAVTTQGYRAHMSNLNAAIGLRQFDKLDTMRARKRDIVARYRAAFTGLPGLRPVAVHGPEAFPFIYVVAVANGQRDALRVHLAERGVGTTVNYQPNHQHEFFGNTRALPVTERLGEEILTLPLYCDLSEEDIARVIDGVASFCTRAERATA